ncbi:hypothetical protein MLD38_023488 [Melastoma candidum]|uniref:Uncharacterized protein n=1 Tax=Melastoma candidum TaxID=119954 RepID=A0ACB9NSR4_9MYRT|nr:hypothetical protein MLD38_023488 [Melastoma candidum]
MAVQAQYPPSNPLLLNRNMQDANDFALQPQQPGSIFLDQSPSPHLLFSAGAAATTQRKRTREMPTPSAVNFNCSSNDNPVALFNAFPVAANSLQLQSQAPQVVDLTQLHNRQPSNVVSTGLRLSFGEQQQQLQQQGFVYNPAPSSFVQLLSDDVVAEIKQQREEMDQFLHAQGEHLRRTLAEKRQRHYRALLGVAESAVARRLREKDAEIEKAVRRQAELEARAAQLVAESQLWQAKARGSEAIAASLQAQLQQAWCDRGAGDEEAAAAVDGSAGEAEDAESAYVDPERVEMVGPSCRGCSRRAATVVVLPCRHLCACPECDRLIQACPLCFCPKSSSVEVFFS